jgi:FkbM family methyltransferase
VVKSGALVVNKAAGNINGKAQMYVEKMNKGMSNSFLRPKEHLIEYPAIIFESTTIAVEMVRLDDFAFEGSFNMIVLDTQGYELEVLKGAEQFLAGVDYIISEINASELYEGCAQVDNLDAFLAERNFRRMETRWTHKHWGDAFYLRDEIAWRRQLSGNH